VHTHALKFPYSSGLPFDLDMVPVGMCYFSRACDRLIDGLLRGGDGGTVPICVDMCPIYIQPS
jgi:hypothetical protein